MQKKGDVWISAILYFGIGIVIITILLTAGLPVINKLRDKNIIIQTKQVMHTMDDNIREVIKEGTGSQRVVTVNIKKGTINVSTAAAFVAAGAGCVVAKHGNKSVSSRSGAADVLQQLGVKVELTNVQNAGVIENIGIAFLAC